jgi:hypothetical protein
MAGRSLVGQATSGSSQFTVPDGLGMPRDRWKEGIESSLGGQWHGILGSKTMEFYDFPG